MDTTQIVFRKVHGLNRQPAEVRECAIKILPSCLIYMVRGHFNIWVPMISTIFKYITNTKGGAVEIVCQRKKRTNS